MDEVPDARDVSESALAAIVERTAAPWELRSATPADRGFCSVYRVEVWDGGATRDCYLKVSPDGRRWGIPTEARIQAVLNAHTSLPVPEVFGVTDDHDDLPTPHYLMSARPGDDLPYEHVTRLDDDALRRLAHETGACLAELHGVPAVDAFGHVRHDDRARDGGRPSSDPAALTVGDPHEDWPTYLRERVEAELDRHADSRFSTLTPDLQRWFDAHLRALDGEFTPVLGRNDHGLHNLLLDPDTGEITAMLDWGYTLAVPAAFDFEFAAYLYSGAFLAGLPGVADRRDLVRDAMLAGYRAAAPDRAGAVADREPVYEALAAVRVMNDFDHLTLPDGTEAGVRDRIRADVRSLIDANPPP